MPSAKRARSASSSDESDADVATTNTSKIVPIFQMRDFITRLREECAAELPRLSARHDILKLVEKHKSLESFKTFVENPDFDRHWKQLFGYATRPKNITLADSTQILQNFLETGHVVTFFEGYPKKPRRAIDYYVNEKKTPSCTVAESGKLRRQFTLDPDAETYRKLADVDRDRFARELQAFLDKNTARLSDAQREYVQHRLRNLAVQADGRTKRPRKSRRTPFDWFKELNKADYAEVPEKKRDRKMAKDFSALSGAEMSIFEKLANK